MKTLEYLKEIYCIIGSSSFVPEDYLTQVNLVIPDYESYKSGNRGTRLDFNNGIVLISDVLLDDFYDKIECFNQYVDEFEKIETL